MKKTPLGAALLLLTLLNLPLTTAHAQGSAFTYQGRLINGTNPATGTYDLRFAVYDANTNGTQQGVTLTNTATAVSNGLFTVTLDFGNQFPGANRWLDIAVRTNGNGAFTPLAPRQALTATPYAIQAANATSATGVSGAVSAAQLTGTISGSNLGAGSITAAMLAPGAVSYLGAPNGSPTNALTVSTNGAVGIGNGSSVPTAGLQISSAVTQTVLNVQFEVQNNQNGWTNLSGPYFSAVNGNLAAIGGSAGVTLVNIVTPTSPSVSAQLVNGVGVFTNLSNVYGLAWAGSNLVAGANSSSAVTIIGCTNPANPVKLAELRNGVNGWNYLSYVSSVAVSGNLLAIGAYSSSAVTLADISNPSAPVLKSAMVNGTFGFTNLSGVQSVAVATNAALGGNLLAIGAPGSSAVTLVNVTDPTNPQKLTELVNGVGTYTNLNSVYSVALSGNLLVIGASSAVTVVDVSNPANPVKLAELRDGVNGYSLAGAYSVAISGNRLAIGAAYGNAVTLVDISNPSAPVLLAKAKDGLNGADYLNYTEGVSFAGPNVLLACGANDSGFTILGAGTQAVGVESAGWVGIGTLDVVGNVLVENATLFDVSAQRVALGVNANASGYYSTALGYYTTASGYHSTALGDGSTASGSYSAALGYGSTASGNYSTALGFNTTATAINSTALGYQANASGNESIALGYQTAAIGAGSTALGFNTHAYADRSTALGNTTIASGTGSTALGDATTASGLLCTSNQRLHFCVGRRNRQFTTLYQHGS